MAQSTVSIRLDDSLKRQFDALCADSGMNAATAFTLFVRTAVQEKKFPFSTPAPERVTLEDGMRAFRKLREEARENGLQDMTLEEINQEIQTVRNGGVEV